MTKTGFKLAFGAWIGVEAADFIVGMVSRMALDIIKRLEKSKDERRSEEE